MKSCRTCKIEKEDSNFWKASKKKDGLQYNCKDCDKNFNKKSKGRREWIYNRRAEMISHLRKIKESTPCADCNKYYKGHIMQFDHISGEKKYNLSKAGTDFSSWQTMEDEIAKCEIVCANCHADRTFNRHMESNSVKTSDE